MSFSSFASNSSTGATTVQLTSVSAGDLIVIWLKWEGITNELDATISDGTSSFTMVPGVHETANDLNGGFGYLLASVATGTVTYTVTFPASATFQKIMVWRTTPSRACQYVANNKNSGASASITSGNITTLGTDEVVFGGYGDYGANTLSATQINGSAHTGIEAEGASALWYRAFSAPFTGQATGTITSADWIGGIIAFQIPDIFEQEGYRFRNDDGNEAAATWLANQDTDITRAANLATRLRVLLNASGNPLTSQFQLEYRKVGDTDWHKITDQ